MRVPRRVALLVGAVLVVLVAAVVAFVVWSRSTPLEAAVDTMPDTVRRASFTDWTAVGRAVPGADPAASASRQELTRFVDAAFERDLTVTSALATSFVALARNYGITPLDAEWEIYGQAPDGSVAALRLDDDVDLAEIEEKLAEIGYEAPAEDTGVWVGTPELLVTLDEQLTPVQENLVVLESERLLLMSDTPSYLESVVAVIDGDDDSLSSVDGLPELLSASESPSVALLWAGDFACEDLAMSQADQTEVREGSALVDQAGGVHPLEGLVMAQESDSTLTVGMVFDSEEQAAEDLQPRADLAGGPAPGQGGTFPERFEVTSAEAQGRLVTMSLDPVDDPVLGDLDQGPVLFATC